MAKRGEDTFGRLFVLGGFALVPTSARRGGERYRDDSLPDGHRPPVRLKVVRNFETNP